MAFTMINARRRVAKGAALLDEKAPENWRTMINLETLSIWNFQDCPLGQIFGSYSTGIVDLGLNTAYDGAYKHGFDIGPDKITYADMDKAWREYLS